VHSDGDVDPRERKATVYLRADPDDVRVMTEDAEIAGRPAVIRRQLERRQGLRFA
jgi:hypothetical protein